MCRNHSGFICFTASAALLFSWILFVGHLHAAGGEYLEDINADGKINIDELTYIEAGPAHDHLRLYTFTPSSSDEISLGFIGALSTNWWSAYGSLGNLLNMIPECSNVTFYIDDLVSPPRSRLVSITFDIVENGVTRRRQISATLRGWAENLLDGSGNIVSDDD